MSLQKIAKDADYFGLFRADRSNVGMGGDSTGVKYEDKPYVVYALCGQRQANIAHYQIASGTTIYKPKAIPRLFKVLSANNGDLFGVELIPCHKEKGCVEYNKAAKWIGERSFRAYNGRLFQNPGTIDDLPILEFESISIRNILKNKQASGRFTREQVLELYAQRA